ncbi:hypothetical protein SD78_0865 [Bacillus badius]|nr:hypothetical protein SD78_0865 [Bacillus badius]
MFKPPLFFSTQLKDSVCQQAESGEAPFSAYIKRAAGCTGIAAAGSG